MPRHNQEAHVPHAGAIQDVLSNASQIEKLEFLDLQGQAFSGTLPKQYNFPNLMALNLINNNIGVGLQMFNLTRAPCSMTQASAAAPPTCMRYAGLCTHAHQALQLLVCIEPLSSVPSVAACTPAVAIGCLDSRDLRDKLYSSTWCQASLHVAVCRGSSQQIGA